MSACGYRSSPELSSSFDVKRADKGIDGSRREDQASSSDHGASQGDRARRSAIMKASEWNLPLDLSCSYVHGREHSPGRRNAGQMIFGGEQGTAKHTERSACLCGVLSGLAFPASFVKVGPWNDPDLGGKVIGVR